MKTVVTITGIRPDFIRMKNVFSKLDEHFNHIMIHTGQHYDDELSKVFFDQLKIRKPDFTLNTGKSTSTQYEQLAYLSRAVIGLIKKEKIKPDLCLFLGDSHSVLASVPMFKEGYKIGHIEGGMRSYDRRMPEEVNRVCCDYVSDLIFVYTPLYKQRLLQENKSEADIFVVGNTIKEVISEHMPKGRKSKDFVLADIHRNENISDPEQYDFLLNYLSEVGSKTGLPVRLVKFSRAWKLAVKHGLYEKYSNIELIGPFGFLDYLDLQFNAFGIVSDSGTAQEEPALFGTPVAVPRNFTERPESVENGCSILVGENGPTEKMVERTVDFFETAKISKKHTAWIGDGKTADRIIKIIKGKI